MSFEKPERILTQKEWEIITEAAEETAAIYRRNATYAIQDNQPRIARYWENKSNRIWETLVNIENEYYNAHPDEDPDRREK